MKPSPKRDDRELLAWAASIIQREQGRGTFGVVSIHLQGGKIERVKIETTELPGEPTPSGLRAVG